jgi:hypothetical protein
MRPRTRRWAFGSAAVAVLVGAVCPLVIGGYTGEVIAATLITLGLGAVVLLVFLEIGLSEDHARDEEEAARRRERAEKRQPPRRRRPPRRPA